MTVTQSLRNLKVRLFGTKKQRDLVKLINGTLADAEHAAQTNNPYIAGQCLDCALKLSQRVPQYNVSKRVEYLTNNYTIVRPSDSNSAS